MTNSEALDGAGNCKKVREVLESHAPDIIFRRGSLALMISQARKIHFGHYRKIQGQLKTQVFFGQAKFYRA